MENSTPMNIYQKLLRIQKGINGLGKDKDTSSQYNPKGYKYVTGDKVLEHIKPLMNEQGLILKQEILSIENQRQDYAIKSGSKSEVLSKVMMKFTWVDVETGEKDENLFGANGQNDWDKGVGSALTYGERYFLLKYFHIATDEDDIDNPDRKEQGSAEATKTEPASTATKATEKPVLTEENKDAWDLVVKAVAGGKTMADIRTKWALTKANETKILVLAKKQAA